MVAGHLQEKKGYFYMVLSYPDAAGKRKSLQTAKTACRLSFLAEWVGFEPTVPEGTTDFESVPL